MAYLLFKYIRRKMNESKQEKLVTADDSQLSPQISQGTPHGSPGRDNLHESHGDGLHSTDPTHAARPSAQHSVTTPEDIARIKQEKRRKRTNLFKIILGLALPTFLAAVDTTIVAPAVPLISSHFNRLSGSFNWIVTAYTLTNCTFVPISGQIADIYGRHAALQFHIFFITIGSVFCAAAVTWPMLLFGRALQGLGAAGIQNLTRIILSDNVSLADNSKSNTVFSLVAGCSYAVGPVIGGYLADASWRYCFVISIPIAVLAHIIIFFSMRKLLVKGRAFEGRTHRGGFLVGLATFDWLGILFFIFGIGLVILGLQWGGTQYNWKSVAVIAPLAIGGVLAISFFIHEYLLEPGRFTSRLFPHQIAMIPFRLFSKRDTFLLMIINFATGCALFSAFYFISIYWELAEGYPTGKAGVQLLYYTPGLGVGVYSAMFLCNVFPRQTWYTLFTGSILEAVGLSVLAWATSQRRQALVSGMLAVAGAGTGLRFMPVVLHAAGIWPTRIANIMSILNFMIPFGGTVGIALMGTVFTNKFNNNLRRITSTSAQSVSTNGTPNFDVLNALPADIKLDVQNAAAKAVMWSFISVLPFMALSIVAAALLGNVWIGKPEKSDSDGRVKSKEVRGKVLYGVFLLSVLRGSVSQDKRELDRTERIRDDIGEKTVDEETAVATKVSNEGTKERTV